MFFFVHFFYCIFNQSAFSVIIVRDINIEPGIFLPFFVTVYKCPMIFGAAYLYRYIKHKTKWAPGTIHILVAY